jgi:hypothetical protein
MNTYTSLSDIRSTKSLLGWGVVAGPVYVATGALEIATRQGFDPLRHSLSLMSNGAYGCVHITMLILTGVFTLAAAVGFYRSRYTGIGRGWAPYLLGLYGLGLIGAGIFSADPALGFPVGTPADANDVSWQGLLHFVSGGIGILGLIVACFSFARTYARLGQKVLVMFSAVTGVAFLAAFAGIASGQGSPTSIIAFSGAVILSWCWICAVSITTYRLHGDACATDEASA